MKPEEVTQYMDAVTQGLGTLAEQMKQPVEQVYTLFLKQNYVNAVTGIVQLTGLSIITMLFVRFVKWGLGKESKDSYNNRFYNNEGLMIVAGVGGFFLAIILLMSFFIGLPEIISRFINPHYMTIQDIIRSIKPTIN